MSERDSLVGQKLVMIRPMAQTEKNAEGWEAGTERSVILVFEDGTVLFASRDEEGNGPGVLVGYDPNGDGFILVPS